LSPALQFALLDSSFSNRLSETRLSETQRPNPFWFGLQPISDSAGSLSSVVNLDYLNRVGFSTHSRASVDSFLAEEKCKGAPRPCQERGEILSPDWRAICAVRVAPHPLPSRLRKSHFFAGQSPDTGNRWPVRPAKTRIHENVSPGKGFSRWSPCPGSLTLFR
jgi:hypothetical protein